MAGPSDEPEMLTSTHMHACLYRHACGGSDACARHTCGLCEDVQTSAHHCSGKFSSNPLNYLSFDWGQHSGTCDDVLRQNMTQRETRRDGSHLDVVIDHWCTSNQWLGAANGQHYSAEKSMSVCICNDEPLQLQGATICTQE